MIISIPGKTAPSIQMDTHKRRHEKKSREGIALAFFVKPSLPAGIPSFPGDRASHPREATFDGSRSPSSAGAPRLSPGAPMAAVWRNSGAVAWPRGVRWRSVKPVPREAYQIRIGFEDPVRRHYREALIDKDIDHARICLLYTSPSPRDLSTSRMPSSA